jgi:hypothetical protein
MIKRGEKESMRIAGGEVVNNGIVSLIDDGKIREIVITTSQLKE